MPGRVGSRPSMPVPRGEVPAGGRTDSRPTLPPAATAGGAGPKSRRPGGSAHARSVGDYLEEAELARGSRQWDEALLALHHAGELEPDNPAVWAQKALTLLLKDPRLNAKEANQLARDSRKADPGLALPYVAMGMLMEHVGETERAGHLYRMALSRDPSCEDALERLDELERSRVP